MSKLPKVLHKYKDNSESITRLLKFINRKQFPTQALEIMQVLESVQQIKDSISTEVKDLKSEIINRWTT